ncbi:MAG: hypothetical protein U7123_10845 [Potamolinea sp.]
MSFQPNQRSSRALSFTRRKPNNRITQLEERMDRTEERLAELEFYAIQVDGEITFPADLRERSSRQF